MRQTNNAINLLNASYQAVFKHAYFTGIASSFVLLAASPYAVAAVNFASNSNDGANTNVALEDDTLSKYTNGYANTITVTGTGASNDLTGFNFASSSSGNTTIYFQTGVKLSNAFLNIQGSDTYNATLVGSFNTNTPISGYMELNGSKLTISKGKVKINRAEFSDSTVEIQGKAGYNGANPQDNINNYSALRTGQAAALLPGQAGETTFYNSDLNLGDYSALDAMGDVSFERGTIKITAAKAEAVRTNIGEIAAKAIIRAQNFDLNTSGSLQVVSSQPDNDAVGAVYAASTHFNSGSTVSIAAGSKLQLAGQISQQAVNGAAVNEGSAAQQFINTTIADGQLEIQGTINNSGDLVLGANSITVNSTGTLNHYSSSQYDVTQNDGQVDNYGTLELGEGRSETDATPFDSTKGTTYTLTDGKLRNYEDGQIKLNSGSSLNLEGGTFVNLGTVQINSGSTLSASAKAINAKIPSYSITQGETVYVADLKQLGNIENEGTVELKDGIFKAEVSTANSLGTAVANAITNGTKVDGALEINNATLLLSNDLDLTSTQLFSTNITASNDSTLATTGALSFTASNSNTGNIGGFSKLQGSQVTIKRPTNNTEPNIALTYTTPKTIAATESLTTQDGSTLEIGNKLTMELSTEQFDPNVTDPTSAGDRTASTHQVMVDLHVASGGTLNVTADPWTAQDVTTASGSTLKVAGTALNSLNQEFKTLAQLTAQNFEFDGVVQVTGGAKLTSTGDMVFTEHAFGNIEDSSLQAQKLTVSGNTDTQGHLNLANSQAQVSQTTVVDNGELTSLDSQLTTQDFQLSNGAVISFTNSKLTVHNKLSAAEGSGSASIALNNSDITAQHIGLNADSELTAINGSQINTTTLRTSGTNDTDSVQVDLTGSNLNLSGDSNNKTTDLNVKLSMQGGSLGLGDALDTIGLTYQGGTFKVNGDFKQIIANSTRVTMDLSNSGLTSINDELKQQLFEKVFDSQDSANAYLSLNGITSTDIVTSEDENGDIVADFDTVVDESGNVNKDYDTETTQNAILKGVDTSKNISGGWKAIQTANDSNNAVNVDSDKTLQIFGATASNNLVENSAKLAVGVNLADNSNLALKSSGKIGDITGTGTITVESGKEVTIVAANSNDTTTSRLKGNQFDNYGTTTVGSVNVNLARLQSDSALKAQTVTANTFYAKNAQATATTFNVGTSKIEGSKINAEQFNASGSVTADQSTQLTVTGVLNLQQGMQIQGEAVVDTNQLLLGVGDLLVGTEAVNGKSGSSATLIARKADLNGNNLVLDPEFGQKTATAFIQSFADLDQTADGSTTSSSDTPMQVNGNLIVGRNSALGIGGELSDFTAALATHQDSNGSLQEDGVGALAYINTTNLALNGHKLVVGTADIDSLKQIASGSDTIYLGDKSALQIGTKALSEAVAQGTLIFSDLDANDTIKAEGGKLIVPANTTSQELGKIFGNQLQLAAGTTIEVQTENGAYTGTIDSNDELHGSGDFTMTASPNLRQIVNKMSDPTFAFYEKVINGQTSSDQQTKESVQTLDATAAVALANTATESETTTTDTTTTTSSTTTDAESTTLAANQSNSSTQNLAYNFIRAAGSEGDGLALEQAARLGTLGVGVQIAQQVSQTGSDAILQRVAMDQSRLAPSGMTVIDNSKSAVWFSPTYHNFSADNFSADNLGYGSDIDLYGFAAGFDHTFNNGLRVGGMLNVGAGDADGSGIASGISNDFSYYGVGVYAAVQPMRDLTLSADLSYNMVDNDLEANSGLKDYGKLTGTVDSTALSTGINALYKFNANGLYITPHAGLRYTRLDLDGYDVKLDGEQLAHASSNSINYFSIPVGVGISTNLTNGDWRIKPHADFTITANFGDDSIKSNTTFQGQSGEIHYNTEFIDSITYGAKAGVQVQNGNLSFGAGVGYTKSSNTDELTLDATARFIF